MTAEPPIVRCSHLALRGERTSLPQRRFLACEKPQRGLFGGVGSGKTFIGCYWALTRPPGTEGWVVSPTYKIMQGTTLRTFLRMARAAGVLSYYHRQNNEVRLIDGKRITFRSAERPDDLIGDNLHWFLGDEFGRVKHDTAWRYLIGRVRLGRQEVAITTTPKGRSHWLYERFVEADDPDRAAFTVSTEENRMNLGKGFIERLKRDYADAFQQQELLGHFIDIGAQNLIDEMKIEKVRDRPEGLPAVRSWDTAATKGGGDYSVGARIEGPDRNGLYYIVGATRGQWDPAERDRRMRALADDDRLDCQIWVPQGRGDAGKSQALYWVRELAGFTVFYALETGDKWTRGGPFAVQVNEGNVRIVTDDDGWREYYDADEGHLSPSRARQRFIRELGVAPMGKHDDVWDAAANGFNHLTRGRGRLRPTAG